MEKSFITKAFLIFLLVAILTSVYFVFKPFLVEFLVAAILVTTFYPLYEKLNKIFKKKRVLTSFVMCLLIILFVIVPLVNLIIYGAQQSITAYSDVVEFFNKDNFSTFIDKVVQNSVVEKMFFFVSSEQGAKAYLTLKAESARDWILSGSLNSMFFSGAKNILASTAGTIMSLLVVFISMFFFFIDGEKMLDRLMYLTPLPNKYDRIIFKKFKDVSYSTIFSTFVTAIAQGAIGAIGFLIVGMPVFFLSLAMAFASIVPYVGTALVWLPTAIYLLAVGQIWQGIFVIVWGAFVVGNSDNVIRTYLIKDKAEVHPLFVFFSILGGLTLFGFWGVIFGPLIISLAVTILHIYEMEFAQDLEK